MWPAITVEWTWVALLTQRSGVGKTSPRVVVSYWSPVLRGRRSFCADMPSSLSLPASFHASTVPHVCSATCLLNGPLSSPGPAAIFPLGLASTCRCAGLASTPFLDPAPIHPVCMQRPPLHFLLLCQGGTPRHNNPSFYLENPLN